MKKANWAVPLSTAELIKYLYFTVISIAVDVLSL